MSEKANVVDINQDAKHGPDGSNRYDVLLDMYVAERRIVRERVSTLEMVVDELHKDVSELMQLLVEFSKQEDGDNG